MVYVAAVAVLAGLLAAVNLLLTVGVVRRLREQTAELADLRNGSGGGGNGVALPAGSPIGEFSATTTDSQPIGLNTLGDRTLVAFFSPQCTPCQERLPAFAEYAASRPGGRDAVLAVVVGAAGEAAAMAGQLHPAATVVVEPDQGPVQQAFGVSGFPAFILVEQGVVAVSHYDLTPVADRDGAAVPIAG